MSHFFLVTFPTSLLLTCRKTADFCVPVYPGPLLSMLSHLRFSGGVYRSLKYMIISSANRDNFTSSLQYILSFCVSFSCPAALAKSWSFIVNESGE